MMNRIVAAVVLALAFALPCAAQTPCRRNIESGFSYCPPDGWAIKQSLEEKFKTFIGPTSTILTPNLNAKDEDNAAPLADHVATSIKYILENLKSSGVTAVTVLDRSEFITASGPRGIRVVFRVENSARVVVRSFQYYFSGKGSQKVILTGTVLDADRNTFEPIFDRALKTFQLDR